MNIPIHQLKESRGLDFVYDYTHHLTHVSDMLTIEPASIQLTWRFIENEVIMDLHVDCHMTLACSKTLLPVPYEMHFDAEIVFGHDEDCDFQLTDPIEISDIIFGYIVSEKPFTIYHPDANKTSFEEERSPHPAFADLDKTYKK